jgi:hypothetical protein
LLHDLAQHIPGDRRTGSKSANLSHKQHCTAQTLPNPTPTPSPQPAKQENNKSTQPTRHFHSRFEEEKNTMTHLSDYSYLDRLIPNIMLLLFLLTFCFRVCDAKKDISFDAFRKGKLQGLILLMYLAAMVLVIVYDILATTIKYDEGFTDTCVAVNISIPVDESPFSAVGCRLYPVETPCRGIITKPSSLFSKVSLRRLAPTDMLWNLACTLRNSGLYMLLAYFNSTVKNMFPKPVMSRWEVKIFAGYSFISLFLYFFLQLIFSYDNLYSTIAPQLLYSVECLVGGILLLLTNVRINKMVKGAQKSHGGASLEQSLSYIKIVNTCLAMAVFMDAFGLGSINLDIIARDSNGEFMRVIYKSKLLTDIFTRIFNM